MRVNNNGAETKTTQMNSQSKALKKFRAKLYQLDGDGRWNDLGTGYFSIDPIPDQNLYKMTLQQEHDSTVDLLENEVIQPHIQFHRQRGKLKLLKSNPFLKL